MNRRTILTAVFGGVMPALVLAAIPAAAFWPRSSTPPAFALDGFPPETVHNYRFAEANPSAVWTIPCYCGCLSLGHRNLLDCFVRRGGGYEPHASGCMICGKEATLVEAMLTAGRSNAEIRAAIDAEFSEYGPGTKF